MANHEMKGLGASWLLVSDELAICEGPASRRHSATADGAPWRLGSADRGRGHACAVRRGRDRVGHRAICPSAIGQATGENGTGNGDHRGGDRTGARARRRMERAFANRRGRLSRRSQRRVAAVALTGRYRGARCKHLRAVELLMGAEWREPALRVDTGFIERN